MGFRFIMCRLVLSGLMFLSACSSQPTEEESSCATNAEAKCESGGEVKDRGFDPCLVNANLPVC